VDQQRGNCNVLVCINYLNVFNKPFLTALSVRLGHGYSNSKFCFCDHPVNQMTVAQWFGRRIQLRGALGLASKALDFGVGFPSPGGLSSQMESLNVCRTNGIGRRTLQSESGLGSAGFLVVLAGMTDAQGLP